MSRLRVISGSARGRKLRMVPGEVARPISDRVKEALFNILREGLNGCTFLDLFAGTGSVGIEALSRGAAFVRFVDRNRRAVETIEYNLAATKLGEGAEVLRTDALSQLSQRPDRSFDYVYVAPPQYKGLWLDALKALDVNAQWLVEDAWVIAQIDPREYAPLALSELAEFDQRRYGNTMLLFYERRPEGEMEG